MDFLSFYWRDVLDIALVTLLLYRILLLIRGTRAFRRSSVWSFWWRCTPSRIL